MAGDDWQLEAVHEQFDVFDKFTEPHSSYAATDMGEILKKVDIILGQQWRVKSNGKTHKPARYITAELIKALPEQENILHMSYVVVVTNEDSVESKLCKIPVFTVLVKGQQCKFIDVSGSVYMSWNAFMENNDLPACEICYPVNGCYDVRGKLKIDFAYSPAAIRSRRFSWFAFGGMVIGAVIVAASFYFHIPPIASNFVERIIPIAEQFLSKFCIESIRQIGKLVTLGQRFRNGNISVFELTFKACKLLCMFYSQFKKEIDNVWEETKKKLSAAYKYLGNIFEKYFKRASDRSQQQFFANVVRVEEEMVQVQKDAGVQINEMNRVVLKSSESPSSTISTVMLTSYNRQIFENCLKESALQHEIENHKFTEQNNCTQPFNPTTESLLILSEKVANQSKDKTLSDVNDVFESLSCVIKDEYQNKIDNYIKGVRAAQKAAGNGIDLDVYNKSLGIVGHPKDHYMKEAMESVEKSRLAYRLKEKIKEFRMDTKIFLIPISKKSREEDAGVYKAIGARGNGKFSAQKLLNVLKESLNDFSLEESTLVVNETNSVIYIRTEEVSIFAYQEVNDENTADGIVYVTKDYS